MTERFQWVLTGGGIVLGFIAYHFEHLLNAVPNDGTAIVSVSGIFIQ